MKKNLFMIILFLVTKTLSSGDLYLPEINGDLQVIHHQHYSLAYSEEHEQAQWVIYNLTREKLHGTQRRTNDFRPDPNVVTGSAHPDDYRGSGYDRGHLVPARDMKFSYKAMSQSFFMSNMTPQVPEFNREIWLRLESVVQNWAYEYESVIVVTGPVLTAESYPVIGANEVTVSDYFYKVILDHTEPELKAIGFILPNDGSGLPLESYAITVNDVEEFTGINFFPGLPDESEEELESSLDLSLWPFQGFTYPPAPRPSGQEPGNTEGAFWINSNSGVRHNTGCRYFGSTKGGYFSKDVDEGRACGICGG